MTNKTIGIQDNYCYMCGETEDVTRHHVIPKSLNPMKNMTIPLCKIHKDVTHPIVKQIYVPKQTRRRLNEAIINTNNLLGKLKSLKKSISTHKLKSTYISSKINPSGVDYE